MNPSISGTAAKIASSGVLFAGLSCGLLLAADPPSAEISNGQIKAKIYLPTQEAASIVRRASIGRASSAACNMAGTLSMVPGL